MRESSYLNVRCHDPPLPSLTLAYEPQIKTKTRINRNVLLGRLAHIRSVLRAVMDLSD